MTKTPLARTAILRLALEPRIVFDAAVAATVDEKLADATTDADGPAAPQAAPPASRATELVFIDASVAVDTLPHGFAGEVIRLAPDRDGLQQIREAVTGRTGITAVHLLAHGEPGEARLGSTVLNTGSLDAHRDALAAIGGSLAPGADLLFYGCRIGQGDAGGQLVAAIAEATGCDVAASDDDTGHAAAGADWVLERRAGAVQAAPLDLPDFRGVLASAAVVGDGAVFASNGRGIYSVDVATGKPMLLTTSTLVVDSGWNSIPAIASNVPNGLLYYVGVSAASGARTLFAWDWVNDTHLSVGGDLSAVQGGLQASGATFRAADPGAVGGPGELYLDVAGVAGGDPTIYRITFSNDGRTVASVTPVVSHPAASGNYLDLGVHAGPEFLLGSPASVLGTGWSLDRYSLANWAAQTSLPLADGGVTGLAATSAGKHFAFRTMVDGSNVSLRQFDPATGTWLAPSVVVLQEWMNHTNNPFADAAGPVPATGAVSGRVFLDFDGQGDFDVGVDQGLNGMALWIVDDVDDNDRVAPSGERVLSVDSSNGTAGAAGSYAFPGLLPGHYVVMAADTSGILGTTPLYTVGTGTSNSGALILSSGPAVDRVGQQVVNVNFGIQPRAPVNTVSATPLLMEGSVQSPIPGVSVTDADGNLTSVTLQVSGGSLTLSGPTTVSGNGTSTVVLSAPIGTPSANFNQTLAQLRYTPPPEFSGAATVTMVSRDATSLSQTQVFDIDVVPVNDDPVLLNTSEITFVEDSAPMPVNTAITVSDVDNATLTSATVRISGNFRSDQDVLSFTKDGSMGNIEASGFDKTTGTLTLTSNSAAATLAQWQSALRSVQYVNGSDAPDTATRTVEFLVHDGSASSNPVTSMVKVSSVNDAPVVAIASTMSYAEGAPPTPVNTALVVEDLDNPTLASATVSISANYASGQDQLLFTADPATMGNITAGTFNSGTGTLTLTSAGATATLAQWQTALRAVQYANSSVAPDVAARTVTYTVNDGEDSSTGLDSTVNVASVNGAPVLSNASLLTYRENSGEVPVNTGLSLTDSDSAALSSATIRISANYRPAEDALSFTPDSATMGDIFAVTYDPSNGRLLLASFSGTASVAQWEAALRAVSYSNLSDTPDTTPRIISFTVSDGAAFSTLSSTVQVVPESDAPFGSDNTVSTAEGTPYIFSTADFAVSDPGDSPAHGLAFVHIDSIPAGDTLTLDGTAVTVGQAVSAANIAAGLLRYTPPADANGPGYAAFSFHVQDSGGTAGGGSDTAVSANTMTIDVSPVNSAPTLEGPADVTYVEDAPPVAVNDSIIVADVDSTTLASASIRITGNFRAGQDRLVLAAGAAMGNIAVSLDDADNGTLLLTSPPGAPASLSEWQAALRSVHYVNSSDAPDTSDRTVTFVVNDGTADSNALQSTVRLTPVDDAPVAGDDQASTASQTAVTIDVLSNDTDSDGGTTLNVSTVEGMAIAAGQTLALPNGTVTRKADGALSFTPAAAVVGTTSFRYTATDGSLASNEATVTVTVGAAPAPPAPDPGDPEPTNSSPTAVDDLLPVDLGGPVILSASQLLDNDSDPEDDPLAVQAVFAATGGTVVLSADGSTITFTPTAGFTGSASFMYSATDGSLSSNEAAVTLTMSEPPPPPPATDSPPRNRLPEGPLELTEDVPQGVTGLRVSDSDSSRLVTTLTVSHGSLRVGGGTGVNGEGTRRLVISGTSRHINDVLTGLTYTGNPDYNGEDTLRVTTSDGELSDTDRLRLRIAPVVDIADDLVATAEDHAARFNVLTGAGGATADDFEDPARAVTAVTQPAHGRIEWTPDGGMNFTPDADFNGTTTFDYTVTAGGVTETATVTLTVSQVEDPTVLRLPPAGIVTAEDTQVRIEGVRVDDPDGGDVLVSLSVDHGVLDVPPASGVTGRGTASITISGPLAEVNATLAGLAYTGAADWHGADRLRMEASGAATGATAVDITVTPVVDAIGEQLAAQEDTAISFNVLTGAGGASADLFSDPGRAVTAVSQPEQATVAFLPDGTVTFTPSANFHGRAGFTYTVTAGGLQESALVTVDVAPVNDAPVAAEDLRRTLQDHPLTGIDVLANDRDWDGDALTVTGADLAAGEGRVTVNADSTISFMPAPGYAGLAQIHYTVSDGHGGVAAGLLKVDVMATSHPQGEPLVPARAPALALPPAPPPALPILSTLRSLQSESSLFGLGGDALDRREAGAAPQPDLGFMAGGDLAAEGLSVRSTVRQAQAEALRMTLQANDDALREIGHPLFDPIGLALLRGAEQPLALAQGGGDAPVRSAASFTSQLKRGAGLLRTVRQA